MLVSDTALRSRPRVLFVSCWLMRASLAAALLPLPALRL
jgi:hypothetical protein